MVCDQKNQCFRSTKSRLLPKTGFVIVWGYISGCGKGYLQFQFMQKSHVMSKSKELGSLQSCSQDGQYGESLETKPAGHLQTWLQKDGGQNTNRNASLLSFLNTRMVFKCYIMATLKDVTGHEWKDGRTLTNEMELMRQKNNNTRTNKTSKKQNTLL